MHGFGLRKGESSPLQIDTLRIALLVIPRQVDLELREFPDAHLFEHLPGIQDAARVEGLLHRLHRLHLGRRMLDAQKRRLRQADAMFARNRPAQ